MRVSILITLVLTLLVGILPLPGLAAGKSTKPMPTPEEQLRAKFGDAVSTYRTSIDTMNKYYLWTVFGEIIQRGENDSWLLVWGGTGSVDDRRAPLNHPGWVGVDRGNILVLAPDRSKINIKLYNGIHYYLKETSVSNAYGAQVPCKVFGNPPTAYLQAVQARAAAISRADQAYEALTSLVAKTNDARIAAHPQDGQVIAECGTADYDLCTFLHKRGYAALPVARDAVVNYSKAAIAFCNAGQIPQAVTMAMRACDLSLPTCDQRYPLLGKDARMISEWSTTTDPMENVPTDFTQVVFAKYPHLLTGLAAAMVKKLPEYLAHEKDAVKSTAARNVAACIRNVLLKTEPLYAQLNDMLAEKPEPAVQPESPAAQPVTPEPPKGNPATTDAAPVKATEPPSVNTTVTKVPVQTPTPVQPPVVKPEATPPALPDPVVKPDISLGPDEKRNAKDKSVLVLIPAGQCQLGFDEGWRDKVWGLNKLTTVKVDAFYIGKYEVTWAQYRTFCAATGHALPREPLWGWKNDGPVVNVSSADALAYAQWAGGTVPTQAQLVKAARGTDARVFPWGNAWDETACQQDAMKTGPQPVGSRPKDKSPYGVCDLAGSVEELFLDDPKDVSESLLDTQSCGGSFQNVIDPGNNGKDPVQYAPAAFWVGHGGNTTVGFRIVIPVLVTEKTPAK